MGFPMYLAMTREEMAGHPQRQTAYMACHLSENGLCDLPSALPPDSILILNDSILPDRLDIPQILEELTQAVDRLAPNALLLDFERAGNPQLSQLVTAAAASFPIIVSEPYAADLSCPVFLSAPLPHQSLSDKIKPWQNRELWLEATLSAEQMVLTVEGCSIRPCNFGPGGFF